jgi:hypothetical protein
VIPAEVADFSFDATLLVRLQLHTVAAIRSDSV